MKIDIGLFDKVIVNNYLDLALQELDILFNTRPTELLGHPTYGINFEQFLWTLTPSSDTLERYIKEKITMNTFYLSKMSFTVNVDFIRDLSEVIYVVKMSISDNSTTVNREYIIKN